MLFRSISVGLGQSSFGKATRIRPKFIRQGHSDSAKVIQEGHSDSAKVHSARPLGFGQSSFGNATRIRPKFIRQGHSDSAKSSFGKATRIRPKFIHQGHSARMFRPAVGLGQDDSAAHDDSASIFELGQSSLGRSPLGQTTRIRHRTRPSYSDSASDSDSAIVLGLGLGHRTRTRMLATVACHQASTSRLSGRTA